MIPRRFIEEWKEQAPWPENAQVEQDLIIERALVEIFKDKFLQENLAFRGGTALHKFYLKPQARYSEDIDLVQIKPGPIKPILVQLRDCLAFLGTKRKVEQSEHNNMVVYPFESEIMPIIKMKLKIEINTREHFSVMNLITKPMEVRNGWFQDEASITTYEIEELLATKLRALYQRRKGRDLFDLYYAYNNYTINTEKLISCYKEYMKFDVEYPPTQKMFIANMESKMLDQEFLKDIQIVLKPGVVYDNQKAYGFVHENILLHI